MKRIFITGIGTDVGKTIASAIVTEALSADYYKPIQCGLEEPLDTERVRSLISNKQSQIFPSTISLKAPLSPHAAAEAEGRIIKLKEVKLPETRNNLIIEGAGGLMVPLNYNGDLMIDLILQSKASVILVSRHYLGSINHTLLSVEALQSRKIPIEGIIFNGPSSPQSEKLILERSGIPCLLTIKEETYFDPSIIKKYSQIFYESYRAR